MNIVIPTADYPPIEGGIGTVTLHVSRELAALGHSVTVVAPYFAEMAAFDAAEPVRVVRYRGYSLGWLRFFPLLLAVIPLIGKADLVLGMNIAYGGVIGWLFRKPYATFAYAYEFLKFRRNPVLAALLLRVYRGSRKVIAISAFTRDKLVEFGLSESHIEVILPGAVQNHLPKPETIEAVKQRCVLDSGRVVLAVGRFIPRKGHLTLVEAFAQVLARCPDALLVLVGRGPTLPDVTRRAIALGIRDRVRVPGRLSDEEVASLYAACEVFALPTCQDAGGQVEGFGLVFAEAHAHGKPVVAGRSGGVVDAVLDQETGFLVDPGDPDALASAILALLDDPALARDMGRKGRDRVERELNWTRFTQRLLAVTGGRA